MKHRVDSNQQLIAWQLRELGYSFASTAMVGRNFPDAVVGGAHRVTGRRQTILVEIKTPGQELSDGQRDFHASWRGSITVAYSVVDILMEYGWLAAECQWITVLDRLFYLLSSNEAWWTEGRWLAQYQKVFKSVWGLRREPEERQVRMLVADSDDAFVVAEVDGDSVQVPVS